MECLRNSAGVYGLGCGFGPLSLAFWGRLWVRVGGLGLGRWLRFGGSAG
jgi:hypothetical protein